MTRGMPSPSPATDRLVCVSTDIPDRADCRSDRRTERRRRPADQDHPADRASRGLRSGQSPWRACREKPDGSVGAGSGLRTGCVYGIGRCPGRHWFCLSSDRGDCARRPARVCGRCPAGHFMGSCWFRSVCARPRARASPVTSRNRSGRTRPASALVDRHRSRNCTRSRFDRLFEEAGLSRDRRGCIDLALRDRCSRAP